LGIAGLVGSGRSELVDAIFGKIRESAAPSRFLENRFRSATPSKRLPPAWPC